MQEKIIEELRHELKAQTDENQELLKINEEHQRINGELRKEIDGLVTVIDLTKEYINKKLEYLEMNKRAIMSILTPQNGYLKADVEFAIREKQELLEILERVNEE